MDWFGKRPARAQGRPVDAAEALARLVVRACREPGLSLVWQRLLRDDEIRLAPAGAVAGLRFGDALHRFRTSAPIGLRRADGTTLLGPPLDLVIEDTDQVIAIGDAPVVADASVVLDTAIVEPVPRRPGPERTIMLGWNRRAALMVRWFDRGAVPGARLDIVADEPDAKAELDLLRPGLAVLEPSFALADTAMPQSLGLGPHDNVIVLSYDEDDADERALVTLLHLREMGVRPVVELTDDRSRELVQIGDDVVAGPETIGPLTAGLFERGDIRLPPADLYVRHGMELTFDTVVEAAGRRGEVAIGYRVGALAALPPAFGMVLNPDRSVPLIFGSGDRLVVLAPRTVPGNTRTPRSAGRLDSRPA
jgi:hypothetical protein